MITVILIGGNSQRFKEAGYQIPKALLPIPGNWSVMEAIIKSLSPSRVIACGRQQIRGHWDWPTHFVGGEIEYIWVGGEARGPLYGFLDAADWGGDLLGDWEQPLVISYCDVLFPRGAQHILSYWAGAQSGAVVFKSQNPRFGYWRWGRVWEKKVVSQWAVSGLFYFRTAKSAIEKARRIIEPGVGLPSLLDFKTKLYYTNPMEMVDLGTPQDYERFRAESVTA